jgi:ribosomal protein L37AE/L43A
MATCPKCGIKHPFHKRGIFYCKKCRKEKKLPISYIPFLKAKKEVLKRDNYQCQLCKRNIKLLVHHIDCNKNNNNLDNLITLCIQCHLGIHRIQDYKIKNNRYLGRSLKTLKELFSKIKVDYGLHGIRLNYETT